MMVVLTPSPMTQEKAIAIISSLHAYLPGRQKARTGLAHVNIHFFSTEKNIRQITVTTIRGHAYYPVELPECTRTAYC
jgi:hypothetical protein